MNSLIIRQLGLRDYESTWHAMRAFTDSRTETTQDECWLLQHPAVFTQGQNGKPEHLLNAGDIPVVNTDRGGQITYHGPGQIMMYTLIDLRRKKINVRQLVSLLETTIIDLLSEFHIKAYAKAEAPGVYVQEKKICSVGLRIRKGCSYHGIAFNVNMDLAPFARINPCGFKNLEMTTVAALGGLDSLAAVETKLITYFMKKLGYTSAHSINEMHIDDETRPYTSIS